MKTITYPIALPQKRFKRFYLSLFFMIVRKGLQAAYRYDKETQKELDSLDKDFAVGMTVLNSGPSFILKKSTSKGRKNLSYEGNFNRNPGYPCNLILQIKSIESAFQIFTFQESIAVGEAYSRFIVNGSLEEACTFIRVLERLEILLLPKGIAKLAVKRYESFKHKHSLRFKIYLRILFS